MQGASRAAYRVARDQLTEEARDQAAAAAMAGELFDVTALLDREPALRRALTDATSPQEARAGLVRDLLGGRVSGPTLDLLAGMASQRWSLPGDLADATEQFAVLATAAAADTGTELDELEDELFRFGRIVSGEPDLYAALASPVLPAGRKQSLLDALLDGKVSGLALRLITQAVLQSRGRSLEAALAEYARLAADWRRRLIALVRVAAQLTGAQRQRLAAALTDIYGRGVQLNVVIDPEVVGGMSIQIGDDFIDGSIASRLAALRRRLAA
jgi:F-type H+-transporting ATPase subunit delta